MISFHTHKSPGNTKFCMWVKNGPNKHRGAQLLNSGDEFEVDTKQRNPDLSP